MEKWYRDTNVEQFIREMCACISLKELEPLEAHMAELAKAQANANWFKEVMDCMWDETSIYWFYDLLNRKLNFKRKDNPKAKLIRFEDLRKNMKLGKNQLKEYENHGKLPSAEEMEIIFQVLSFTDDELKDIAQNVYRGKKSGLPQLGELSEEEDLQNLRSLVSFTDAEKRRIRHLLHRERGADRTGLDCIPETALDDLKKALEKFNLLDKVLNNLSEPLRFMLDHHNSMREDVLRLKYIPGSTLAKIRSVLQELGLLHAASDALPLGLRSLLEPNPTGDYITEHAFVRILQFWNKAGLLAPLEEKLPDPLRELLAKERPKFDKSPLYSAVLEASEHRMLDVSRPKELNRDLAEMSCCDVKTLVSRLNNERNPKGDVRDWALRLCVSLFANFQSTIQLLCLAYEMVLNLMNPRDGIIWAFICEKFQNMDYSKYMEASHPNAAEIALFAELDENLRSDGQALLFPAHTERQ